MRTLPVTLITGFLGSGKTTVLNHILQDPAYHDTAVIINEFGEIAIDHLLVEQSIENTIVLQNGCICCTIRGDLVDTLIDLLKKMHAGLIPSFKRVIIETTGLASPAPLLQALVHDPLINKEFTLNRVVTTIDVVNGKLTLQTYPESVAQLAAADIVLLTKSDLATEDAVHTISQQIQAINPTAALRLCPHGQSDPAWLLPSSPKPSDPPRSDTAFLPHSAHDHTTHEHSDHNHSHFLHENAITTFTIREKTPISEHALTQWLHALLSLRSQALLRVKGLVHVKGQARPVVIQAVQHLVHPPTQLPSWPDADQDTRLVFITRALPESAIRASLDILLTREQS